MPLSGWLRAIALLCVVCGITAAPVKGASASPAQPLAVDVKPPQEQQKAAQEPSLLKKEGDKFVFSASMPFFTGALRAFSPGNVLLKLGAIRADPKADEELQVVSAGPETDEDVDAMVKQERAKAWSMIFGLLFNFGTRVVVGMVLAGVYTLFWAVPELKNKDQMQSDFEGQDFAHGCCSCFEDVHVCFLSFCCMPCRWADTVKAAGISSYWKAVAICIVLMELPQLLAVFSSTVSMIAWLCFAGFLAYYRQKLRTAFALQNETSDQVKDFLMMCFCCCCATAQEARQARSALKLQEV